MAMTQAQVQAALNAGGVVTLPPGTYRFADLVIPANATLDGAGQATLEGSRVIPATAWKSAGSLRYAEYVPLPVSDGHGIAFTKGENLADPLGKHADQVWTRADGDTRLRRVLKAQVAKGRFAVEGSTLWCHRDDVAAGILVSDKRIAIKDLRGTLAGVSIKRYSPTAGDGAAINVNGGAIADCTIDACSFASVAATGTDPAILRSSITRAGWMGVTARQATNLLLDRVAFDKVNDLAFFATSPQSGALKTSRCRQVTVLGVTIDRTIGQGLWFDQSTSDVTVSGASIRCSANGVFFELSHGLTLVGSTIESTGDGVKVAGASGAVIVGNEIRGHRAAVGIYVDPRSRPGWSDPRVPLTAEMKAAGVYPSDRRSLAWRDARITWLPRVEVLERNTLHAPPGGRPAVHVLTSNGGASSTLAHMVPLGYQT